MEEISNMNFDHLSFSTFMKRLSNWVLNDGIDMGVKLIIGVLVIAIGFKIINNISKKFLKFAELKAVDVTIVKFLKSCINISLKCILLLIIIGGYWDVKLFVCRQKEKVLYLTVYRKCAGQGVYTYGR